MMHVIDGDPTPNRGRFDDLLDSMQARPILRTLFEYSVTFCSLSEVAASNAIFSAAVWNVD